QFYPLLAGAYILFFFPSRYSRGNRFGWVLLLYVLAKAAELLDAPIYALSQQAISGHTLKHLIAGLAVFVLAEMLRCRIPLHARPNDAMADY
ncbi:MAG: alkaline phytoceramidase, partial [Bacteroidetes bacterium]